MALIDEPLDETLAAGYTGHVEAHETIHGVINQLGTAATKDVGVAGGVAGVNLSGKVTNADGTVAGGKPLFLNVQAFGAKGDGTSDDTAAITAALAAIPAAGGQVFFPAGTYLTGPLVQPDKTVLAGAGTLNTVIKLKPGSNADLLVTAGFATNTGTTNNGVSGHGLRNLTLDANRQNQTALARCWVQYGYNFICDSVWFKNGWGGGIYSEWGGSDNPMESHLNNCKVMEYGSTPGCIGVDWNGPHDSKWHNTIVYTLDVAGGSGGHITATDVAYGATPIGTAGSGVGSTATFPTNGTQFDFVTTAAADTRLYPTGGGKFVVPLVAGLGTFAFITYTGASTTGGVTTFTGCTAAVSSNRSVKASDGIVVPTYGVLLNRVRSGESALQLTQCHVWGRNHFGIYGNCPIFASNCEIEGSFISALVTGGGTIYQGGALYGTNGQSGQPNEVGVTIGTAEWSAGRMTIDTTAFNYGDAVSAPNWNGGVAAITYNSGNGNRIKLVGRTTNTKRYVNPYVGSQDSWECFCQNAFGLSFVYLPQNSAMPTSVTDIYQQGAVAILGAGMWLGTGTSAAAGLRMFAGNAAPSTGTWRLGDIILNTAPTAGGTFAWQCTTAGTPGTWKAVSLAA